MITWTVKTVNIFMKKKYNLHKRPHIKEDSMGAKRSVRKNRHHGNVVQFQQFLPKLIIRNITGANDHDEHGNYSNNIKAIDCSNDLNNNESHKRAMMVMNVIAWLQWRITDLIVLVSVTL